MSPRKAFAEAEKTLRNLSPCPSGGRMMVRSGAEMCVRECPMNDEIEDLRDKRTDDEELVAEKQERDDPLAEDPLTQAETGYDLAHRLGKVVDDLEWRQAARDHQARMISIREDLKRPPAARLAEWQAAEEAKAARALPDSAAAARELLGRMLLKCEDAAGELFRERDLRRFGLVGQLAHASARLVAMLDQVDRGARAPAPKRLRKVRGKRP